MYVCVFSVAINFEQLFPFQNISKVLNILEVSWTLFQFGNIILFGGGVSCVIFFYGSVISKHSHQKCIKYVLHACSFAFPIYVSSASGALKTSVGVY